jgi:imidazole glycerol phosphate synthase subunit HisF
MPAILLAVSVFHFNITAIEDLKAYPKGRGVSVR